jgi:ubiquinone/menaquinone biosynthesis C-methylase UbiE
LDIRVNSKLKEKIARLASYYKIAHKGSLNKSHPGMKVLFELSEKAKSVLDLGCGEGTRLSIIAKGKKKAVGVDYNDTALRLAKKRYPKCEFVKSDLGNLPFKDDSFDLVYLAYVLEHLDNPEKVIIESGRVTKDGGYLVFVSPNYGAPSRASPPFQKSRVVKFLSGVISDFTSFVKDKSKLRWRKVKPLTSRMNVEIDWDTVVEPYLGSLITFTRFAGLETKQAGSLWSEELDSARFHQKVFKYLGNKGIYPFRLWGPHILLVVKKR